MRQLLKTLTKMTVSYGAIQWLGPAITFIFTPILTRILTPSDYGVAEYVLSVVSAVNVLALLALPQALTTHFNDRPQDVEWQKSVTGSALTAVVLIGIPIGAIIFVFSGEIAGFGLQDEGYGFFFQLVGVTIVLGLCTNILIAAAQAALKVRWGLFFSSTTLGMTVLGNVVFIIILRLGALGLILVPVVTGLVLSAVTFVTTRSLIGKPDLTVMKTLVISGIFLLPSLVAVWMLQLSDRLILVHFVSTEALGHYSIANKIASLLAVFIGPVFVAWTPLMLAVKDTSSSKQQYADMARFLIALILFIALGLGLFANEILIILTRPAYLPAAPYVGFLTYIYILGAVGTILGTDAMGAKRLKELSGSVLFGAVVNLILNLFLIPPYGLWGATFATIVGYAIPQVIIYNHLKKQSHIPYETTKFLVAFAVQISLLVLGTLFLPSNFFLRITVKLSLFLFLPISFLIIGVITKPEINQVWVVIRHRVSFYSWR